VDQWLHTTLQVDNSRLQYHHTSGWISDVRVGEIGELMPCVKIHFKRAGGVRTG